MEAITNYQAPAAFSEDIFPSAVLCYSGASAGELIVTDVEPWSDDDEE